jgi:NAD(P)H dehydrogenase (quinone)
MKILVILGHPSEKSFNHAIAETAIKKLEINGHEVWFHDLYKENFDPILDEEEIPQNGIFADVIKRHCSELSDCDGIIVIHPNWWGQPPAVLKGWIDRVFRPGIAYEFREGDKGEGIPAGLLKAQSAIVFNTSNTCEERENLIFKDPLEAIWKDCIFQLCGIHDFYRKMFRIVITSTEEDRKKWLKEVDQIIEKYFPDSTLY